MTEKCLLIVEDDPGLQSQLRWCFDDFDVEIAGDRKQAMELFRRHHPQVVTLDLGLPPDPGGATEGIATLEEILSLAPETKVIVATGNDERSNAVKAIGLGAFDFYQKPVESDILTLTVERAYRVYELEQENKKLQQFKGGSPLNGIIANSPEMAKVCRTVEKIAASDVTTLLLGASGTGKEVFARALHDLSPRAGNRMVAINCAAIPANLLESELFGYEKGAFTGASKQTIGKIEHANGGTLFLDEIGDLPFELQAKLLRFLQERVIERIGGREEIPIDVRVICATHQNIQQHIQQEKFREDLYYRISEVTIKIPPLNERDGDALLLAHAFLDKFNEEFKKHLGGFTQDAINAINNHTWPGNVRELESKIKRAVILADGKKITPEDMELEDIDTKSLPLNLKQVKDEAESNAVRRALMHQQWNISNTAKALGITRPTLYSIMEKHGISEE
ncbi:MAG: PEP-CTERM-box response regulator transcription factor [Piscirickettsiaceae bacterium]|nr:MAG: PEP-CTERM-box response regulator transcription factor [Piscirickettsiaceae bacterium]